MDAIWDIWQHAVSLLVTNSYEVLSADSLAGYAVKTISNDAMRIPSKKYLIFVISKVSNA